MRHYTRIGNIYEANVGELHKRFFQFIGRDVSDMNSDVIRIFNHLYRKSDTPPVDVIILDSVDCYMHTSVHAGVLQEKWKLYGRTRNVGDTDICFRDSNDYGFFPKQRIISRNWTVWKMNKEREFVGPLPSKYHSAYIGSVYSPDSVVYRIENQRYLSLYYPDYE